MVQMLSIQYFGYRVQIHAENTLPQSIELMDRLRFDFSQFIEHSPADQLNLKIILVDQLEVPEKRLYNFKTRNFTRYWLGWNSYYFENSDQTRAILNFGSPRVLRLSFKAIDNAQEQIFLMILSSIGEFMEEQGWSRIHGFGIQMNDAAWVVPLKSGSGKSSFVDWLIENSEARFFGDETIFTDGQSIRAFPIRRALRTKASKQKEFRSWPVTRIQAEASHFQMLLFGNQFSRMGFFWEFFWGLGNAQMAEYVLRFENFSNLVKVVFQRIFIYSRLNSKMRFLNLWESKEELNFHQIRNLEMGTGVDKSSQSQIQKWNETQL